MSGPLYTRDILRLAAEVPHLDPLPDPDGEAELRAPLCGSRMRVAVTLVNGRVAALSQSVEACAFGQASAALLGAHALGRSKAEVARALDEIGAWLGGTADKPGGWPGLDVLAPVLGRSGRHGAVLLPFRTLLAAINQAGG